MDIIRQLSSTPIARGAHLRPVAAPATPEARRRACPGTLARRSLGTGHRGLFLTILGALLALNAPEAAALQADAGRVTRIAQILGGQKAREVRTASSIVQLHRGTGTSWVDVAPRANLFTSDSLRVQRYVNAQVSINQRAQRGVLTFLSELYYDQGRRIVSTVTTATPLREALYELRDHPERPGEVAIAIGRGAVLVDWAHGLLEIDAAGTRSVIAGTRLIVSVDSVGDEGVLYLETGAVAFPDYPQVQVAPGQLVRLQRGVPPSVLAAPATALQEYNQALRYGTREVWSTPFWQRPPVMFAAAAAVVGAAIAVASGGSDGDGDRDGTVIVRLPR